MSLIICVERFCSEKENEKKKNTKCNLGINLEKERIGRERFER